jgi:serine/threonine-protein kinase RsbW
MSKYDSLVAAMPQESTSKPEPRLTLQSCLDDLVRVWPWVEALGAEYAIPGDTQFAIQLSLEEALSNIIRHGYGAQPEFRITVDFAPDGSREMAFVIEDQGPPFNPLTQPVLPETSAAMSIDELRPGGRGIRLLRKFAGRLDYQRLPEGNRLTIRFTIPR